MAMSENSTEEYTAKIRDRYARMTGRKARSKLLDEFVEVTGWERKHANKVLLGIKRRQGRRGKTGENRTKSTRPFTSETHGAAAPNPAKLRQLDPLDSP